MKITRISGYEVIELGMTSEHEKHVVYFKHEETAKEFVLGNPWHRVRAFEKSFQVFDTCDEYYDAEDLKAKTVALAKLTPKERKLLNLA